VWSSSVENYFDIMDTRYKDEEDDDLVESKVLP
jgi:hypothetical protein